MRLTGPTRTSWGGILGAILEFCQPQSASSFGFVLKNFFVTFHLHHQTAALVSKFSHCFNMGNSCLLHFVPFLASYLVLQFVYLSNRHNNNTCL